jgi:hypothetical protein
VTGFTTEIVLLFFYFLGTKEVQLRGETACKGLKYILFKILNCHFLSNNILLSFNSDSFYFSSIYNKLGNVGIK